MTNNLTPRSETQIKNAYAFIISSITQGNATLKELQLLTNDDILDFSANDDDAKHKYAFGTHAYRLALDDIAQLINLSS